MKIPNLSPQTRAAAWDIMRRTTHNPNPVKAEDLAKTHSRAHIAAAVRLLNAWEAIRIETDDRGRRRYHTARMSSERRWAIAAMLRRPLPEDDSAHAKIRAAKQAREGKTVAEHRAEQRRATRAAKKIFAHIAACGGKMWVGDALGVCPDEDDATAGIDRLLFLKLIEPWTQRKNGRNPRRFYRIRDPQTASERRRLADAMRGEI